MFYVKYLRKLCKYLTFSILSGKQDFLDITGMSANFAKILKTWQKYWALATHWSTS